MIGIIVVTYESERDIELCLRSIARCTIAPYKLVILDNASQDTTRAKIEKVLAEGIFADNAVFEPLSENIGYAPAINKGVELLSGAVCYVFLNPDTIVCDKWLMRATERFNVDEQIGILGPTSNAVAGFQNLSFWLGQPHEGYVQYGVNVNIETLAQQLAQSFKNRILSVKFISGFCLIVHRKVIDDVGCLDASFFLGKDDLEFSLRVRLGGYKLCVVPDVFIYHRNSGSISSLPRKQHKRIYKEMGIKFCALLRERYGDSLPSSEELFGIDFFHPEEYDKEVPYPEPHWQQKLMVGQDGKTLELIREFT